jgi:hypothetical protein
LADGGHEALLDHLLKVDLSKVDLRKVPATDVLFEQKMHGMGDDDQWWMDVLQRGELPPGCDGDRECSKQLLARWYHRHGRGRNSRKVRASMTALGKYLKKSVPGLKSDRTECRYSNGIEADGRPVIVTHRDWSYRFPSLGECRDEFAKKVGQKIVWEDEDPDLMDALPEGLEVEESLDFQGMGCGARADWTKAEGLEVRQEEA